MSSMPDIESKQDPNPVEISSTEQATVKPARSRSEGMILTGVWLLAISLVILALYAGWRSRFVSVVAPEPSDVVAAAEPTQPVPAPVMDMAMPPFTAGSAFDTVFRRSNLHTIIPSRPRQEPLDYTVEKGDSVFAIAKKYNLKPETVLWANYDQLQDRPDSLAPGMLLKIPPVDGVYYRWQEADTIESVAQAFKAKVDDILSWPGNKLDLTNPQFTTDEYVMVPDGQREFRSWIVPQIARGKAGVDKQVYGPGACEGSYDGVYGGGGFIWPSVNQSLSGNDFWSGHLGIDIGGATGDLVWASDSGVIVFAGWSTGGYGNMVMIDHGNGYQTVYAHLNSYSVRCGQSVYQGNVIGTLGSTGNSTGSHLHFEIRLFGQFVNPWHVLP